MTKQRVVLAVVAVLVVVAGLVDWLAGSGSLGVESLAFLPAIAAVGGIAQGIGGALGGGGGPSSAQTGDFNFNGSSQKTAQERQLIIGGVVVVAVLGLIVGLVIWLKRK